MTVTEHLRAMGPEAIGAATGIAIGVGIGLGLAASICGAIGSLAIVLTIRMIIWR